MVGSESFEPYSFANMNVVWLRQHGDGETPQYVATDETSWAEADDADRVAQSSLYVDNDAGESYSITFQLDVWITTTKLINKQCALMEAGKCISGTNK